jgi:L-alanine-DL-glutamate epimerase-like enolase superfamily enzyme
VKVSTDEGITGWGECSDTRVPHAVCAARGGAGLGRRADRAGPVRV